MYLLKECDSEVSFKDYKNYIAQFSLLNADVF